MYWAVKQAQNRPKKEGDNLQPGTIESAATLCKYSNSRCSERVDNLITRFRSRNRGRPSVDDTRCSDVLPSTHLTLRAAGLEMGGWWWRKQSGMLLRVIKQIFETTPLVKCAILVRKHASKLTNDLQKDCI